MLTHPHKTTILGLYKFVVEIAINTSSMNDFDKKVLYKRDFTLATEFYKNWGLIVLAGWLEYFS